MFGLPLNDVKQVQYWGCRAIFHPDRENPIDIVPDRQTYVSADGDNEIVTPGQKAFMTWVNERALPLLREQCKSLSRNDDREVVVREFKYIARANPKASHGYLYIGAAQLPVVSLGHGTGGNAHCRLYQIDGDEPVKWSNREPLPCVGDEITLATSWGKKIGTVVGYAVEHGYLNALTKLATPPKVWVEQNYKHAVEKARQDEITSAGTRFRTSEADIKRRLVSRGLLPKREALKAFAARPYWAAGVDVLPQPVTA